ncbi:protein PIMREG isoform X2 [Colius striatus]|uniref:protein PIMREG isoform X2 n=1 Tax=Colius striatus TaxID=57412 RepID=UPI002B1D19F2|nr:protein PIMREG isoform X2 [Colius striatus]
MAAGRGRGANPERRSGWGPVQTRRRRQEATGAAGLVSRNCSTLLCLILALILVVFEIKLTKNWNKMVSVLQNVKATMAWRKHQLLPGFDENDSPVPDKFKRRTSLSSLNTIRMSLRKRVPLKHIELNFPETSAWESLEMRQKSQTLQRIKRTAKNAFGTVSQKIQKSCQSPVHSMMTFPDESISRSHATNSTKKRCTTPQTPCCKKNVTPTARSKGTPRSIRRALLGPTRVSEDRGLSSWLAKDAVSLRRSRRVAALKSPYSAPAPANSEAELDCSLELVSSGISQLKHISQAFDDAIVQEESDMTVSLIRN